MCSTACRPSLPMSRSVPCAEVGSPTRSAGPIERSATRLASASSAARVRAVDHELRDPRPAQGVPRAVRDRAGREEHERVELRVRGGPQCRDRADPCPADAYGARPAPSRLGDRERHVGRALLGVPRVVRAAVAAQVEREHRPASHCREPDQRPPRVQVAAEIVEQHEPVGAVDPALAAENGAVARRQLNRLEAHSPPPRTTHG